MPNQIEIQKLREVVERLRAVDKPNLATLIKIQQLENAIKQKSK